MCAEHTGPNRTEVLAKLRAERRRRGRSLRGLYRLTTQAALAELAQRAPDTFTPPPVPARWQRPRDEPTPAQLHDLAVLARRHGRTVPPDLSRADASRLLARWKQAPPDAQPPT